MAKKRVHEIAKQQGLTSKEVLAALNAAGIEAKAAASSVEEAEALRALEAANGGASKPAAGPPSGAPTNPPAPPAPAAPATAPAEAQHPPDHPPAEAPPTPAAKQSQQR